MPRKCPYCGGPMYVTASEPKRCGLQQIGITHKVIRRRLQCDDCERKMTTYEIDAQDLISIRETLHSIRKKARLSITVMGRLETAIRNCKKDLSRINDNQSQSSEV